MDAGMNSLVRRDTIHLIEWRSNLRGYFYGSALHYRGRGWISYENGLMPPGTVIQRWKSDYNYQSERHEPELVPLREGEEYCIRAYWTCEPENGLFLKVVFYDIRGKMIGVSAEFGSAFTFVCPEGCCSWELQLVNGGVRSFELYYLAFTKAAILKKFWLRDREMRIDPVLIFGEPQGSTIVCPDSNILAQMGNALFLPVQYAENVPVLKREIFPILTEKSLLVGYGPRGNRAVADLTKIVGCRGFMCWDRNEDPPMPEDDRLSFYISRPLPKERKRARLPLIAGMADYTHRLQDFPSYLLP